MDISGIMPTNENMTFEICNPQPLSPKQKSQGQKLKPMLDRNQTLGENNEGNAWWNRKTSKSQINTSKMQPKNPPIENTSGKQQEKNQNSDAKEEKPKKKGKGKGKTSK